jgi:DNA modification methylase
VSERPWQREGGLSAPGIGPRPSDWPSYGSTGPFGSANPSCATCGGRLRGKKKCACAEPDWRVNGQPVGPAADGAAEGELPAPRVGGDGGALYVGDCLEVLRALAPCSVDAVVTDPPYGWGFMGANWDGKQIEEAAKREEERRREMPPRLTGGADSPSRKLVERSGSAFSNASGEAGSYDFSLTGNRAFQAWCEAWAAECLRVLKPGGYLLSFCGPRTYHRLACGVEDAGFEVRDMVEWMYGSGFPKSLNVSKSIDKMGGDPAFTARMAEAVRAAREARGWTVAQADAHFCGGSTNWSWIEGRREQVYLPDTDLCDRLAGEWPELAEVMGEARKVGESLGRVRHARGEGDFPKIVGARGGPREVEVFDHATEEARRWEGWGTALKPAHEPIVVARKPLAGTVAANVLAHGVGAINVGATRLGTDAGWSYPNGRGGKGWGGKESLEANLDVPMEAADGRWPANVVLSHHEDCELVGEKTVTGDGHYAGKSKSSPFMANGFDEPGRERTLSEEVVEDWECVEDCPVRMLDEQTGPLKAGGSLTGDEPSSTFGQVYGTMEGRREWDGYGDRGGASRFFYCAKASRAEREAGLEHLEPKRSQYRIGDDESENTIRERLHGTPAVRNHHPTVKPIALMRWLVRLVCPPGGTVLEPFAGSGTTLLAAELEGMSWLGVEREEDYLPIIEGRLAFWREHGEAGWRVASLREGSARRREERAKAGQMGLFEGAD